MLKYYGVDLIQTLYAYYLPRLQLAEERGYAVEGHQYCWLFEELRERVNTLRQTTLYIDALPKFMVGQTDSEPMQYVVRYSSRLFSENSIGKFERDDAGVHPLFKETNPYWVEFQEIQDLFAPDYDIMDQPMFYVDLCEYVVRAMRLYLQIRESQFHAIDRNKFDELMGLKGPPANAG